MKKINLIRTLAVFCLLTLIAGSQCKEKPEVICGDGFERVGDECHPQVLPNEENEDSNTESDETKKDVDVGADNDQSGADSSDDGAAKSPKNDVDLEAGNHQSGADSSDDGAAKNPNERNIVFVGASGGGKTTTLEVLKNEKYVAPLPQFFSRTREARIEKLEVVEDGITYVISVLDTPGLFDRRKNPEDNLTNDRILVDIKSQLRKMKKVHGIFFVFSLAGTISAEDIGAMKTFSSLFDGLNPKPNISFLITKSEVLSKKDRMQIIEQLKQNADFDAVFNKFNSKCLFLGANNEVFKQTGIIDMNVVQEIVSEDRQALIKYIINLGKPTDTTTLH